LWTVNDLSTSFLLVKFYENLKQHSSLQAGDVAVALNQAQTWLRDVTMEELQQWTSHLPLSRNRREQLGDWFSNLREYQPFQNPYNWAAFCAIGQ
jgi:CHAT domain-containing protein